MRSCVDSGRCFRISFGIASGLSVLPSDALWHAAALWFFTRTPKDVYILILTVTILDN